MGGVAKRSVTTLGCEKLFFGGSHTQSPQVGDAHSLSICGTLVLELLVQVWAEESKGLGEGDGLG